MTTVKMMLFLLTSVMAYLIGAINFAVIFTKIGKKKDIKLLGSGNPGTMNVLRTVGKFYGAMTFLCDALKGLAFVLIGRFLFTEYGLTLAFVLGIITIIGHIFPIYSNFKGGKGVATTIGVFMGLYPVITLAILVLLILWIFFGKYGFIGSLVAVTALSITGIAFNYNNVFVILICLFNLALVFYTHRGNIKRLKNGTENTLNLAKKDSCEDTEIAEDFSRIDKSKLIDEEDSQDSNLDNSTINI